MADLNEILHALYQERDKIATAIELLEQLQSNQGPRAVLCRARRGRKSMSAEERLEVSERMRNYWAGRKAERRGYERSISGN